MAAQLACGAPPWRVKTLKLINMVLGGNFRSQAYPYATSEQYTPPTTSEAGGPDIEAGVAMSRHACTHMYTVRGHGVYMRVQRCDIIHTMGAAIASPVWVYHTGRIVRCVPRHVRTYPYTYMYAHLSYNTACASVGAPDGTVVVAHVVSAPQTMCACYHTKLYNRTDALAHDQDTIHLHPTPSHAQHRVSRVNTARHGGRR